jgi:hypothetical protein
VSSASTRTLLVLAEHVLVSQDELGGLRGLHGHAEFRHLDRSGVGHERLEHVRVHHGDTVERFATALRVQPAAVSATYGKWAPTGRFDQAAGPTVPSGPMSKPNRPYRSMNSAGHASHDAALSRAAS